MWGKIPNNFQMDQKNPHIGLRIKEIREEKKLSRLAFATSIGIDNSTLGKIEKGELGISKTAMGEIISKYGVSYEWLQLGKGSKYAVDIEDEDKGSLLLKIYENTLNAKAHEQATAEMVKEIYQKVMNKDEIAANARYSALLTGFLIEGSRGQQLSGKTE